jgi:hypothetical protein
MIIAATASDSSSDSSLISPSSKSAEFIIVSAGYPAGPGSVWSFEVEL